MKQRTEFGYYVFFLQARSNSFGPTERFTKSKKFKSKVELEFRHQCKTTFTTYSVQKLLLACTVIMINCIFYT